jgi:hypothetical protein
MKIALFFKRCILTLALKYWYTYRIVLQINLISGRYVLFNSFSYFLLLYMLAAVI